MIKRYCDSCSTELAHNVVINRIKGNVGNVSAEITVGVDGVWNSGDLCASCVLRVVQELATELIEQPRMPWE